MSCYRKEYITVLLRSYWDIEDQVNGKIAEGYEPIGSPFVVSRSRSGDELAIGMRLIRKGEK